MARWVLSCKSCREVFVHSAISDTMPNYYLPLRPEFSAEGDERECPNCKAKSVYQGIDLRYQVGPIRRGRTARSRNWRSEIRSKPHARRRELYSQVKWNPVLRMPVNKPNNIWLLLVQPC
jgi:hypothetical protein